jgi:hypothetical protein
MSWLVAAIMAVRGVVVGGGKLRVFGRAKRRRPVMVIISR